MIQKEWISNTPTTHFLTVLEGVDRDYIRAIGVRIRCSCWEWGESDGTGDRWGVSLLQHPQLQPQPHICLSSFVEIVIFYGYVERMCSLK